MLLGSATVRDLDRLTARVFDSANRTSGARFDAYRIDDTFHIDIDLPGVDPAGIDISADDESLTVRCERRRVEGEPSPGERQVSLSEALDTDDALDTDRLDARYESGVLTVRIPVKEKAAKKVSARTAAS